MVRFTHEIGQPVVSSEGTELGHLRDLTVDLDDDEPVVERLLLRTRRGIVALVSWDDVASFEHDLVRLGTEDGMVTDLRSAEQLPLDHGELLLGRDVLDTQIVDVAGVRLARVGEVLLTRRGDDRLVVGAVDVGFGSVCRRLGLRRVADRLGGEAVGWDQLHLTSARGHRIQLATTKAALHRLDARELARLLSRISASKGARVMGAVPPSRAAAALTASHPDVARGVVRLMAEEQLAPMLDELPRHESRHLRHLRQRPPRRRWLRHRPRRSLRRPHNDGTTEGP